MVGASGGRRSKIIGRDMMNEIREIRGSKAMEGLNDQDKELVLDTGVHWMPVEGHSVILSEQKEIFCKVALNSCGTREG